MPEITSWTTWQRPPLPDLLTKQYWDRKKGRMAKMKGSAGMGPSLTGVEQSFGGVDWDKLELSDVAMGLGSNNWSVSAWEAAAAAAKAELNGNVQTLVVSLRALRDTARQTSAMYQKSRVIPKSTRKLVDNIATTADHMSVALNPQSLGDILEKMYKEQKARWAASIANAPIKAQEVLTIKAPPQFKLLKDIIKYKQHPELVKSGKTWQGVCTNTAGTLARELGQNVGNIVKFSTRGYSFPGLDVAALSTAYQQLEPWAGLQINFDNDTREQARAKVETLEAIFKLFKTLLPTGG